MKNIFKSLLEKCYGFLSKPTKLAMLVSMCLYTLFKRKSLLKKYNVKIKYCLSGYILIKFSEGFAIKFIGNPMKDLHALYGYIQHYIPKKGDIIIDGGAYYGLISIYISKILHTQAKIFIFEPDSENLRILRRNLDLNRIQNIVIIEKGLRSSHDFLSFDTKGSDASAINLDDTTKGEKIEVVNIIEEMSSLGIHHIDFIKMDIEGAEVEAIKGIAKQLTHMNVNLAIASYHTLPGEKEQTYKELERLFSNIGYTTHTGWEEHLTTYAYKK